MGDDAAMTEKATTIRPRVRDAVIQSLRTGVVPRTGQHLIQVGRANEVKALIADIDRIADGGAGSRFVIGAYGSGKTFFLNLIRTVALEKGLVTVHADLSPDRRLHASKGQARSLYTELMRNMSTRGKADGGAMTSVVERFVTTAIAEAEKNSEPTETAIRRGLADLSELTGGYDFAEVVARYWEGHNTGNEQLQSDAVRWLRGEYAAKTDARNALGVRTIIDDTNVYDMLKLLAVFVRLAGFRGLLVCLDEMVNLYKLANTQARNANYEQILRIVNDSTQGHAEGVGFVFCGTDEFLTDQRKGLYSYEALRSRLAGNAFATGGRVDYTGPVIHLSSLTQEDFFILLQKLTNVYAAGDPTKHLVDDEAITAFMQHAANQLGAAYFRTPRVTIKEFVDLLATLDQNPGTTWSDLLSTTTLHKDTGAADEANMPEIDDDDELTDIRL
jgi:hypothetical protein